MTVTTKESHRASGHPPSTVKKPYAPLAMAAPLITRYQPNQSDQESHACHGIQSKIPEASPKLKKNKRRDTLWLVTARTTDQPAAL